MNSNKALEAHCGTEYTQLQQSGKVCSSNSVLWMVLYRQSKSICANKYHIKNGPQHYFRKGKGAGLLSWFQPGLIFSEAGRGPDHGPEVILQHPHIIAGCGGAGKKSFPGPLRQRIRSFLWQGEQSHWNNSPFSGMLCIVSVLFLLQFTVLFLSVSSKLFLAQLLILYLLYLQFSFLSSF